MQYFYSLSSELHVKCRCLHLGKVCSMLLTSQIHYLQIHYALLFLHSHHHHYYCCHLNHTNISKHVLPVSVRRSQICLTVLGIPASKEMYPATSYNKWFKTNIFSLKITMLLYIFTIFPNAKTHA